LQAELNRVDLPTPLEVHPDQASSKGSKNPVHVLRVDNRSAVNLDDYVTGLQPDLLLNAVACSGHHGSLPTLDLVLRANRRCQRNQLELAKDVTLTRDSRVAIRDLGMMGEKVISIDLRSTGVAYGPRDTAIDRHES
jgi:hypothetical protein